MRRDKKQWEWRLWLALIIGCFSFGSFPLVYAGPANLKWIPADIRWLIHWNTERFGETSIGKAILDRFMAAELDRRQEQIRRRLGLRLEWWRIQGITLLGWRYSGPEKERGVALIWTSDNISQALEQAIQKQQTNHSGTHTVQRVQNGPAPIYRIDSTVYLGLVNQTNQPVVMGASPKMVQKVQKVLLGQADHLSPQAPIARFLQQNPSAILTAAFQNTDQIPDKSFQKLQSIFLTITEKPDQTLLLSLTVQVKSDQAAQQLFEILRGLRSFLQFTEPQPPFLQEIAAALQVHRTGRTLHCLLPLQQDLVFRLLQWETHHQKARSQKS